MAKMFETKALEGITRKSSIEKPAKDEPNANEDDEDVDDIFDDIIMPDLTRKTSNTIMDKVDMYNKADATNTQKIINTVSALGDSHVKTKKWVEGGTFEIDDGTFTQRRKKSIITEETIGRRTTTG
jgi:uncharacterized protein YjgD (DUF1641 family)